MTNRTSTPTTTLRSRLAAATSLLALVGLASGCAGATTTAAPAAPATSATAQPTMTSVPAPSASATVAPATSNSTPSTTGRGPAPAATYPALASLPAAQGSSSVRLPADTAAGRAAGWQNAAVPLLVCSSTPSTAPSLANLASATTLLQSGGESYAFQSMLRFTSVDAARMFVADLMRASMECTNQAPTASAAGNKAGTRPMPAVAMAVLDEGRVVGFDALPRTGVTADPYDDGTVYYVGRKGNTVIVTGAFLAGNAAAEPKAELDRVLTEPIIAVAKQI